MKWVWVLIVVLLVPVSVQAKDVRELNVEIGIDGQVTNGRFTRWPMKGEEWPYPYSSRLGIKAQENLEDVSLHIEFSTVTSERHPLNLDAFQAGRCDVLLLTDEATTPQIFPNRQGQDLDLWMPYLGKGTGVIVVIGWKDPRKKLFWAASLTIQSSNGMKSQRWEDRYLKDETSSDRSKSFPKWAGTKTHPIQSVPLGTVCDQVNISTMPVQPA